MPAKSLSERCSRGSSDRPVRFGEGGKCQTIAAVNDRMQAREVHAERSATPDQPKTNRTNEQTNNEQRTTNEQSIEQDRGHKAWLRVDVLQPQGKQPGTQTRGRNGTNPRCELESIQAGEQPGKVLNPREGRMRANEVQGGDTCTFA